MLAALLVAGGTGAFAETVVDATRTIVLASPEVSAMGGAGIGFAQGAGGIGMHPAAPANRREEQRGKFHAGFSMSAVTVGPGDPIDLANVGHAYGWDGGMLDAGASFLYKNGGGGIRVESLTYRNGEDEVQIDEGHVVGAWATRSGRASIGLGWRPLAMTAQRSGDRAAFEGSGLQGGVMVTDRPSGWNAGAVARTPVRAIRRTGDLDLPVDAVVVGGQMGLGFAWARPVRTPDTSKLRGVRYREPMPMRVAADVVLDGAVEGGILLESRLAGEEVARGLRPTLSPRAGLEIEPWRGRLHLRGGSYLEPSRTDLAGNRFHGTGGFELKIVRLKLLGFFDDWLAWETAVDAAPRFLDVTWVGIGLWRSGVVGARPYEAPKP